MKLIRSNHHNHRHHHQERQWMTWRCALVSRHKHTHRVTAQEVKTRQPLFPQTKRVEEIILLTDQSPNSVVLCLPHRLTLSHSIIIPTREVPTMSSTCVTNYLHICLTAEEVRWNKSTTFHQIRTPSQAIHNNYLSSVFVQRRASTHVIIAKSRRLLS